MGGCECLGMVQDTEMLLNHRTSKSTIEPMQSTDLETQFVHAVYHIENLPPKIKVLCWEIE